MTGTLELRSGRGNGAALMRADRAEGDHLSRRRLGDEDLAAGGVLGRDGRPDGHGREGGEDRSRRAARRPATAGRSAPRGGGAAGAGSQGDETAGPGDGGDDPAAARMGKGHSDLRRDKAGSLAGSTDWPTLASTQHGAVRFSAEPHGAAVRERGMVKVLSEQTRSTMGVRRGAPALRWAVRLVGAALLLGNAWIHEHLYNLGYATVPMIGPLFRIDGVLATAVAVVVLLAPGVWFALACLAGALLQLGTLAGLAASLTVGVFGFTETLDAPFLTQSVVVEVLGAAVLLLGAWAAAPRPLSLPHRARGRGGNTG